MLLTCSSRRWQRRGRSGGPAPRGRARRGGGARDDDDGGDDAAAAVVVRARPTSDAAQALRERQARWKRTVTRTLLGMHLRRQLRGGWRGIASLASLACVALRVVLGAAGQAVLASLRGAPRARPPPSDAPRAAAGASA